ncbi:MAG: alpha/beta hydrolase [Gammaproteobacteria bacterium]|nr:MAG: alpha/beta hydrolase [Gammaproteobacteria bacterium]
MPLDPRAKRFLDTLAASGAASTLALTVEQRRRSLAQLLSFAGPLPTVGGVEERTFLRPDSSLRVRIYAPAGVGAHEVLPGLVYFHGGGLVAGSLETHDGICRALAAASRCRLLSVDYRLAPEHSFPAAIDDGLAATWWVATHAAELGLDPDRLGVCGDSAGATLAAVVCQSAAAFGQPRLACQFLLCPIMDYAAESDSRRSLAQGYLIDRATLEHDLRHYLGPEADRADRADPRVSPLRAPGVMNLPPTVIHTAEFDPLRDEGAAYAERLRAAGVKITYRCHPGMIHLFYGLGALIPYAGTAFGLMGADVRSLMTKPAKTMIPAGRELEDERAPPG